MTRVDSAEELQALLLKGRTVRGLALGRIDLRGRQLAGLRADGVDFHECDLRASSLRAVQWAGCILRATRLESCDLSEAVLRLCDLDEARAQGAVLTGARIENCSARGANFDGANLTGAVLTDTDFARASLRDATLERVEASGVNFRGADLRGARLTQAVLNDADLRGADLTQADVTGADLHGADLRGAIGVDHAPRDDDGAPDALPQEVAALAGSMTPIVLAALQSAGRQGMIDDATLTRLNRQAANLQRHIPPRMAVDAATLNAVAAALDQLGGDAVPKLLSALGKPAQDGPPPEAIALIRRLCGELSLGEGASAEDLLRHLTREP